MEMGIFRDLSDGALFIEELAPGKPIDPNGAYDIYQKYGDHEAVLVGSISEGRVFLFDDPGAPTSDYITSGMPVMCVSQDRVIRQAA